MHRRADGGFTLIEVAVAFGVFAVVAAVMGTFVVAQIRWAAQSQRTTAANAVAEEELEDLRALRYGEIESRSREVAVGNQTFTVATTVLDDTPGNNMKEITVDVSWPQPGGRQNVQLKTVYTEVRR